MTLNLDALEELRSILRDFVATEAAPATVRAVIDAEATHAAPVWDQLVGAMGMAGIGIPEEYGGAGYGFAELGVVLEELGRGLTPVPFLATAVVSVGLLLECADEAAQATYLAPIAAGSSITTVVFGDPSLPEPSPQRSTIVAKVTEGIAVLEGVADVVIDAGVAETLFVVAAEEGRWVLAAVDRRAHGLTVSREDSLDLTRPLYRVELAGVRAEVLGSGDASWPALVRTIARVSAAVACEQVGGAARSLEMIVEYAGTREQFGRPIGSFQAIKHRCADLLVEIEAARSIAYHARATAEAETGAFLADAAAAKSWCSEAYVHAAQENIQLHGGIGFTWEHDAHLHLKRARTMQLLWGSPREQRAYLATAGAVGTGKG